MWVLRHLDGANPSIQRAGERPGLLQVSDKHLILLIQTYEVALAGPEVVASASQEIPGGDLVRGGIGSSEWGTVDGKLDEAGSDGSGRVVLELNVFGNLNERGDNLTVELGNPRDDALKGLPEIAPREGEVYDSVAERYGGKDLAKGDIPSIDRGAISTGVGDGGVGVGSTVPLHGVGDDIADVTFASLAFGLVEKSVGLSDNLFGELDEGKSPLADLSLEFRVDSGGVGHMDRGTGILDNTALVVEADVKSTEVFTPPVGGDNKDFLTIQVLLNRGVGAQSAGEVSKGGVGVATDDEVEALGVLGEFLVLVVTDVGHGHDTFGKLLLLDVVDGVLHSLGDVEELGSGARAGDPGGSLGGNADNGKVVLLEDLVGLDVLHELGVVALDICTDSWEGQVL